MCSANKKLNFGIALSNDPVFNILIYKKHIKLNLKNYYGHQGDRNECPYYRGVHFREVGFIWILVSQGPSELSIIERCP